MPHVGRLAWPVRVYVLVIAGMWLAAFTLPLGALTLGAGAQELPATELAPSLMGILQRELETHFKQPPNAHSEAPVPESAITES